MIEKIKNILNNLYEAETWGGKVVQKNGTIILGKVPHLGPEAWLHEIYAPLNEQEIKSLELNLKMNLSTSIKDFYRCCNGLSIFSDELRLYGYQKIFTRSIEADREPYSIILKNVEERLKDAKKEYLFLGSYKEDGSQIIYNQLNGKVVRSERYASKKILNEWENIVIFLESEIIRLSKFYSNGFDKDVDAIKTPQIKK